MSEKGFDPFSREAGHKRTKEQEERVRQLTEELKRLQGDPVKNAQRIGEIEDELFGTR